MSRKSPRGNIVAISLLNEEMLNKALQALRSEANEEGIGAIPASQVLMKYLGPLGIRESQATKLMIYLQRLELFATVKTGYHTYSFTVDTHLEVITEEHLKALRGLLKQHREARVNKSSDSLGDDGNSPVVRPLESDPARALVTIIETLENRLKTADKEVETLKDENKAVKAERDALQAQVTSLDSERVRKTIERYSSPS